MIWSVVKYSNWTTEYGNFDSVALICRQLELGGRGSFQWFQGRVASLISMKTSPHPQSAIFEKKTSNQHQWRKDSVSVDDL